MSEQLLEFLVAYNPQDFLIKEGDEDDNFFCLLDGEVGIWKGSNDDTEKLIKLGKISDRGEYFGEMSFLLEETRTASIRAEGPVKVLKFPGEMLPELLLQQPALAEKFLTRVADRLRFATSQAKDMAAKRNELLDDATKNLQHAKRAFQKTFILLGAVQTQFQNPLLKSAIEWMSRDKLLLGGRMPDVDEDFLQDVPTNLAEFIRQHHVD